MYDIKLCSEVSDELTFKAFKDGFADYMIQVELDKEKFFSRFFGPEGNDRELSYIALKEGEPVGITLGGLKVGENYKTLRCGGMAIVPTERGTGLAKELMAKHEKKAREIECRQLFLEVINGNERAVSFYKKIGYEKIYDLTYRRWVFDENKLIDESWKNNRVEEITYEDMRSLREHDLSHLPWQGDFPYFECLPCNYYGIHKGDQLVAGVVASKRRIFYLWVKPEHRHKGYARALLYKVIKELNPEELQLMYANNAPMHTFANQLGMLVEPISQYEMYKWL